MESIKPVAGLEKAPELVAVIAAAISAFEEGGALSSFTVRKINRASGPMTTWTNAGIAECVDSRRM